MRDKIYLLSLLSLTLSQTAFALINIPQTNYVQGPGQVVAPQRQIQTRNYSTPSIYVPSQGNRNYNTLQNYDYRNGYYYPFGGGYYTPTNYYDSNYYDNSSINNDYDTHIENYPQGYSPAIPQAETSQYGLPPSYSQGIETGHWAWITPANSVGGYWLWVLNDAQGNTISNKAIYFTDPYSDLVTIGIQNKDGTVTAINVPVQVFSSSSATLLYIPGDNGNPALIALGSKDKMPSMMPSSAPGQWVWKTIQAGAIGYWQWIAS